MNTHTRKGYVDKNGRVVPQHLVTREGASVAPPVSDSDIRERVLGKPKQRRPYSKKNSDDRKQQVSDELAKLSNSIIHALDEAIAAGERGEKWELPWHKAEPARNALTGEAYQGINFMILGMMEGEGIWAGYEQWKKAGLQVRKGETGTRILAPMKISKKEKDDQGNEVEKYFILYRTVSVHSIEQCEDREGKEGSKEKIIQKIKGERKKLVLASHETLDKIIKNAGVKTEIGNSAYFSPVLNVLTMPKVESFKSSEGYYGTYVHELIHASGHSSRLNRTIVVGMENGKRITKEDRAEEELVAELGAAMVCRQTGLEAETREDHIQYLASWRKAIKSDKDVFPRACRAAQKAALSLIHT